jgi:hypothetical protein
LNARRVVLDAGIRFYSYLVDSGVEPIRELISSSAETPAMRSPVLIGLALLRSCAGTPDDLRARRLRADLELVEGVLKSGIPPGVPNICVEEHLGFIPI